MAKRFVSRLKKGRKSLFHISEGRRRNRSARVRRGNESLAGGYGQASAPLDVVLQDMDAFAPDFRYGVDLPEYPLEIVDYFGHYIPSFDKAA